MRKNLCLTICTGLLWCGAALAEPPRAKSATGADWPIVTRRGTVLYEGDKPFRFFGLAAPNIQANESQLLPDFSNRFPDEFELRDAFLTMKRLGGRATRTFSLSVHHPADKGVPVHIPARRTYNEEAFRCLDRVIALAHEYDVRLIIPFLASQSFATVRGVDEFAALAGKPGPMFWTDEEVKADFRHFLDFVLNRRNTVNGLLYKDDPAILAWQLGNELGSYPGDRKMDGAIWAPIILEWSKQMAAHIKKVDPNHLVAEAGGCDRDALLEDPSIDLISTHLYEYWCRYSSDECELDVLARRDLASCKGKKPLVVDEFGLGTTQNLRNLIGVILEERDIVGGLLWSQRSHRRDGGWYYHNEGGTVVNSFHYPGFAAGFAYEETRLLDMLREASFRIRGQVPPPPEKPTPAPVLLRREDGLTWRGSTGAASYTLERAENAKGPFVVLATNLEDSVVANVKDFEPSPAASFPLVLYHDESAVKGRAYLYRIKGASRTGESTEYSPVLQVTW